MANQNAPYGFRFIGTMDGESSNFGFLTGQILSTNTNKIFSGDVLGVLASGGGGVLDVATVVTNGAAIGGIAIGFAWSSKQNGGKRIFMPYWPGNGDANGNVSVRYVMHRDALFEAQCLLGPVTYTSVGRNVNFNVGAGGNTFSGISSFSVDDSTLGSTNGPFTIYGVPGSGPGAPAIPPADPSSAYNSVVVRFSNQTLP